MCSVHHLANGDITARSASHYLARGRHYLRLRTLPILKIAISFTSLIPCPIPPREHREKSDSTSYDQKVLFVKIGFLKRLTLLLKRLTLFLKGLTCQFLNKNRSKILFFLLNQK